MSDETEMTPLRFRWTLREFLAFLAQHDSFEVLELIERFQDGKVEVEGFSQADVSGE